MYYTAIIFVSLSVFPCAKHLSFFANPVMLLLF